MNTVLKYETSELIPLLIQYKKELGHLFPIEKLKHLTNEDIIERLKECLETRNLYETQIFKLDKVQKLSDNDIKNIVPLIQQTMEKINYDYKTYQNNVMEFIKQRENGKKFIFNEHIEALVMSLLSNHRWGDFNILNNKEKIDSIFNNYDKEYLKNVDSNIIIDKLKKIHCTNPMIKKQMGALAYNIKILEKIEKEYNSLDNFVLTNTPNEIANTFNDSKYKLRQVGRAFSIDYLRRVGINTCKSSVQLERLFGKDRLGILETKKATGGEVLSIINKMSKLNNISELEVETLLQHFCLSHCANICGENPNCKQCCLRNICNYDK